MNKKYTGEEYRTLINNYLKDAVKTADDSGYRTLAEAMEYSLTAGGKRIRPVLVLEFCRICGGDVEKALPAACGIEMIHTYSLIHDDLPCMDNDDLRRGRPTNHKVYGECTATLAGDALQAHAFSTILSCELSAESKAKAALILADGAGVHGMCGGQYMDMAWEGKKLTEQELTAINDLKTGALLAAACKMGVALAGGDDAHTEIAGQFGKSIGLAFQIRDDMLDAISTEAELGKPIGSDADENKNTYMALLGEEKCAQTVHELTENAVRILRSGFEDTLFLEDLAYSLENRRN